MVFKTKQESTMKKLADVKDIEEGKSIIVQGPEGEIALFKVEGEIFALKNECPHMEGPLGEGDMDNRMVTCPWHGWQFDVRTGACENMPGEDALKIPIKVENGEIYLIE